MKYRIFKNTETVFDFILSPSWYLLSRKRRGSKSERNTTSTSQGFCGHRTYLWYENWSTGHLQSFLAEGEKQHRIRGTFINLAALCDARIWQSNQNFSYLLRCWKTTRANSKRSGWAIRQRLNICLIENPTPRHVRITSRTLVSTM